MITGATPLLVTNVDPVEATKRYILSRTNKTPYTEKELDHILYLYKELCRVSGVDVLLALTQMVHETAALTSEWSLPPKRNPAGIGVTGAKNVDGTPVGQWFETWVDSVQAHVGLLLAYRFAAGEGNDAQKRLINHLVSFRPSAPRGGVKNVSEMSARWAADPAYVTRLEQISAAILSS